MDMKRFVMGIDGGATKTHVMICDTELNKVCLMEGGASSHEFLPGGFDEAAGVLEALIDDALFKAGIGIGDVDDFFTNVDAVVAIHLADVLQCHDVAAVDAHEE